MTDIATTPLWNPSADQKAATRMIEFAKKQGFPETVTYDELHRGPSPKSGNSGLHFGIMRVLLAKRDCLLSDVTAWKRQNFPRSKS